MFCNVLQKLPIIAFYLITIQTLAKNNDMSSGVLTYIVTLLI